MAQNDTPLPARPHWSQVFKHVSLCGPFLFKSPQWKIWELCFLFFYSERVQKEKSLGKRCNHTNLQTKIILQIANCLTSPTQGIRTHQRWLGLHTLSSDACWFACGCSACPNRARRRDFWRFVSYVFSHYRECSKFFFPFFQLPSNQNNTLTLYQMAHVG